MLVIHRDGSGLKYSPLMDVYSDDIKAAAEAEYPRLPFHEALFQAEQDFYAYMTRVFFQKEKAFCAVWENYHAALRMEPYEDGYLLTGLTTAPSARRKGYASMLLGQTLQTLPAGTKIYSHVDKSNAPSVAFHEKFGFQKELSYARMLNGELLHNFWTFSYRN